MDPLDYEQRLDALALALVLVQRARDAGEPFPSITGAASEWDGIFVALSQLLVDLREEWRKRGQADAAD